MTCSRGVQRFALGGFACLALVCGAVSGCGWNNNSRAETTSSGELTEAQREMQYFYYVNELVPCMRALRFEVPPVPDMENFLRQVPALAWSPWNALRSRASDGEIARIRAICPPNPVDLYPTPLPIREVAVTGRQLSRSIGG